MYIAVHVKKKDDLGDRHYFFKNKDENDDYSDNEEFEKNNLNKLYSSMSL